MSKRRARPAPKISTAQLWTLRSALRSLADDPPLELGTTSYAATILPNVTDLLQRGLVLQRCLRIAIAALRPAALAACELRRWWPHRICTLEFIEGVTRDEVLDRLAISVATYTRAKQRGLNQIATIVPRLVAAYELAGRPPGSKNEHLRLQPADVIAATLCGCEITNVDRDNDRLTLYLEEPRMGSLRLVCGSARLLMTRRRDGALLRLPSWQRTIQWADWPWPSRLRLVLADGQELAISLREAEVIADTPGWPQ